MTVHYNTEATSPPPAHARARTRATPYRDQHSGLTRGRPATERRRFQSARGYRARMATRKDVTPKRREDPHPRRRRARPEPPPNPRRRRSSRALTLCSASHATSASSAAAAARGAGGRCAAGGRAERSREERLVGTNRIRTNSDGFLHSIASRASIAATSSEPRAPTLKVRELSRRFWSLRTYSTRKYTKHTSGRGLARCRWHIDGGSGSHAQS